MELAAPHAAPSPPGSLTPRALSPPALLCALAELPHYESDEWDWLRGALSTVDRSYGPLLNTLHHHIADTHVAHHLVSTMPHYHAQVRVCVCACAHIYVPSNVCVCAWVGL